MTSGVIIVRDEVMSQAALSVADDLLVTVASTAGPKGCTIALSKPFGAPDITKDGYKVAKHLKYKDQKKNAIVSIISQSCTKCNEEVGDGTTTSCTLAATITKGAFKVTGAGANRVDVKNGILKAGKCVSEALSKLARSIASKEEIEHVATNSANGDPVIGKEIAKCVDSIGKDGVITVEESKGSEVIYTEQTKGMQFDRGYLSPYFVTNAEKMCVEAENAFVLLTDKKISSAAPLVPLLEAVAKTGRFLLIIAEDVDGEALALLAVNKLRGNLKVAAVKAPGFGDRRKEILGDIACLTGAKYVISDDIGVNLEDVPLSDLGMIKNVKITKDMTVLVSDSSEDDANDARQAEIQNRIKQIKNQIDSTTSDYEKEKLRERLAKLSGGVAVLKVGGASELEVKECKDRVEDALHATRAAIEQGVVPGGGVAFLYSIKALESIEGKNDDERLGINVVREALYAPIRRIVANAGVEPAVIIQHLLTQGDTNLVYDVRNMKYSNAFSSGVIDPLKVVRVAFDSAISVSSLLIGTDAFMVDDVKDSSGGGSDMSGMGGMGGGMDF